MEDATEHPTAKELDEGLDHVRSAPADEGTLELLVRRPRENEREVLEEGTLDPRAGLVGDDWSLRPSSRTENGGPNPDAQLTLVNTRAMALVAGDRERWPLAGDQLYVDFDVGEENLPAGTRLVVGGAILEITTKPHLGCKKFSQRFGADALRWVNTPEGRELRLRGVYARVVARGTVRSGDTLRKA